MKCEAEGRLINFLHKIEGAAGGFCGQQSNGRKIDVEICIGSKQLISARSRQAKKLKCLLRYQS
jgi:hypothetical protein